MRPWPIRLPRRSGDERRPEGEIDGIIMTGGLANSAMMTSLIREWIQFIAPVFVYPGEDEMAALAEGGLRVLRKKRN